MTNYTGRLWNLPEPKIDRWLLRAGTVLLACNGMFILVSEGFVLWLGLIVGAILSCLGLRKTCKAAISRMDECYTPYRSYRVTRRALGLLVIFIAFLGLALWNIITGASGSDDDTDATGMCDMPGATVAGQGRGNR